jgi:hypothetical protein
MLRSSSLVLLTSLLTLAACTDDPAATKLGPSGEPRLSVGDTTLSFYVEGTPDQLHQAGSTTLTVRFLSGGVGPHYYRWFERLCDDRNGIRSCESNWRKVAEGWDLSTVKRYIYSTDIKREYVVDLADSQDHPATRSETVAIAGPKEEAGPGTAGYSLHCTMPAGYYPHLGTVCVNGECKTKSYRRNACTNSREYQQ